MPAKSFLWEKMNFKILSEMNGKKVSRIPSLQRVEAQGKSRCVGVSPILGRL